MRRAKEYTSIYVDGKRVGCFCKPRNARKCAEKLRLGGNHVQVMRELVEVKG